MQVRTSQLSIKKIQKIHHSTRTKFRYLYSNPEGYLSGASDDALEEVP
jgi:hypothetical protein